MIIYEEQILKMTGYENAASAEKCLLKQGISVIHGKNGRISTTMEAINAALLNKPVERPALEIDD